MDDLISRQAAIDAIWDGINMDIYTREVKEILEGLPTAMIVHCKECVYYEKDSYLCDLGGSWDPNDYCSSGRMEENDEE